MYSVQGLSKRTILALLGFNVIIPGSWREIHSLNLIPGRRASRGDRRPSTAVPLRPSRGVGRRQRWPRLPCRRWKEGTIEVYIAFHACKLKFRLRELPSCSCSTVAPVVCFQGRVAGLDATEAGNEFFKLKFSLQACCCPNKRHVAVKGCRSEVLIHATHDHVYLHCRVHEYEIDKVRAKIK